MELKKRLGKRIQELRVSKNLKQAELAEMVGIATKHQSCVETGKNYPSAELIEKYAKILKVDVSEILHLEHIKPQKELLAEIQNIIKNASNDKIVLIYKILKDL